MLTFRIAITAAVIAFITALTASLVFTELETSHAVARAAASAAMDAASANTLSCLPDRLCAGAPSGAISTTPSRIKISRRLMCALPLCGKSLAAVN